METNNNQLTGNNIVFSKEQFEQTLIDAKLALDDAKVRFFLVSGTLLGVVRENGFIPHTNDIDLGLFSEDFDEKAGAALIDGGFQLRGQIDQFEQGYKAVYVHKSTGVPVDLCIYYQQGSWRWFPTYGNICRCMKFGYCRWKFSGFGLEKITFLDRSWNVPTPTDRYLSEKYGPAWRTPKQYAYWQGVLYAYTNRINEFSLINIIRTLPFFISKIIEKIRHANRGKQTFLK